MDLLTALVGRETRHDPLQQDPFFWFMNYPMFGLNQTLETDKEVTPKDFEGYVQYAYKQSGVVFACEYVRLSVFSEARLMYRQLNRGEPGDLFTTSTLTPLRHPGKLLSKALLHADFGGNAFIRKDLKLLRPDWVDIVLGVDNPDPDIDLVDDPDAEVVGYLYHPGGRRAQTEPIPYGVDEVAHWAPIPDPLYRWKGMSWMTPVVRDVVGDKQAVTHKNKFYEKGATPNMVIKGHWTDPDKLREWTKLFREQHEGAANAYKSLILGEGMDATVVGRDFQQIDFKAVQGASETRIAAASGVGAVVAQLSEGLQGSSLNAGNYQAARRRVADVLFRPLWRDFCATCEQIVAVPRNAELWYDERDISFLQEDLKDAAEIQHQRAQTVRTLLDAGYEADTVVPAVDNDDFTLLEHSGLFSVQLQPPGTTEPSDAVTVDDSDLAAKLILDGGYRLIPKSRSLL